MEEPVLEYTLIYYAIFESGPTVNSVWVWIFEHQKDGAICQHIVKISFPFGIEFDIVETHSRGRKV